MVRPGFPAGPLFFLAGSGFGEAKEDCWLEETAVTSPVPEVRPGVLCSTTFIFRLLLKESSSFDLRLRFRENQLRSSRVPKLENE